MNVLMIAAAPETEYDYIKPLAQQADYIICADGGVRHAQACGIRPDLVIGDFDSGSCPDFDVEVIRLKPEKDDTDLLSCTREALRRGADTITYVCASGGRIDHFLSNLSQLEFLYEHGCSGVFVDSRNRVTFHGGGTVTYPADPAYKYVGIIPLDDKLTGLTLRGTKYVVTNAEISRFEPYTTSNEPAAPEYSITIQRGRALVIESKDK